MGVANDVLNLDVEQVLLAKLINVQHMVVENDVQIALIGLIQDVDV